MRGWGGGSEPRPLPSWTVTSQSLPGLLAELASASVCASMSSLQALCSGLPLRPLPENRGRWAGVPHAPVRTPSLSPAEEQVSHQPMPAGPFALWVLSGCVQVGISCSWVSRELQLLSSASHPAAGSPEGCRWDRGIQVFRTPSTHFLIAPQLPSLGIRSGYPPTTGDLRPKVRGVKPG